MSNKKPNLFEKKLNKTHPDVQWFDVVVVNFHYNLSLNFVKLAGFKCGSRIDDEESKHTFG